MLSFTKQPWDKVSRTVNVSGWAELRAGAIIESVVSTVLRDGVVIPEMVLEPAGFAGAIIAFHVQGGEAGLDYIIRLRAELSGGRRREVDILMFVRD